MGPLQAGVSPEANSILFGDTDIVESSPQSPDPVHSQPPPSRANPVEARLQLAAIVDSSDDAIISKDLQGIITSWNGAAARLFGYTEDEIVGRSVLTLIPPELHSEEPEILRKVSSGERIDHYETRRVCKDGTMRDISLTISPIRDMSGRIIGISKIARDITDRKRTEEALIQSERLAAIGRMAAAIAHEVNNPLEAILNLVYLLSRNPSLDEEAQGYTNLLLNEVVRVSEITKQTLSFYRDTSSSSEIQITEVLESVLKLHRPVIERKSIRVFTDLQSSARMWARAADIRQVLTNLVINALDALPRGGELKVKASALQNGHFLCVTIADNGTGIPGHLRDKVFEPFFSTKNSKGTGLGLWVSQSIVRKYGGTIRLRTSTNGRRTGTVFRVCLPYRASA
jgi:PAS domain S-box-containing protein